MPQSSTAGQLHHPLPEAPRASAGPRLASVTRDALRNQRLPLSVTARAEARLAVFFGNPRRLARRGVLYRTGDAFNALYLVRVGSFKSVALVDDGREQITGYSMAGDIVGMEGLGLPHHTCDVVALEDSEVSALPFARIDQATRDPAMLPAPLQRLANAL